MKALKEIRDAGIRIKGCSHITGGGFYENIPRMLPEGMRAVIRKDSYEVPAIFRLLQEKGGLEEKMMYIKESKLMIGMRLHALIFAATVGTPMIGISYDPKIDSYLKLIEQPSIGNVDTGWSPLELTNMALDIISNYEIEKISLENKTIKLKSLAPYTAKKALEIFKRK